MLLDKTNVQEKLLQDRQKVIDVDTLLHQVEQILSQNTHERHKIAFAIREKSSTNQNEFVIDLLETDKIFHIDQIKAICIAYRLRFLTVIILRMIFLPKLFLRFEDSKICIKPHYKDLKLWLLPKPFNCLAMMIHFCLLLWEMGITI